MLSFVINGILTNLNKPPIFSNIVDIPSPLNIIKLIITINNVYILLITFGIFCSHFNKNTFSIINNTPKYNPHITKFHSAPCHNPVSIHTIIILRIHFSLLTLFPPNGIYM